ncbi:HD domain-containing phosphohydrolase [Panacagrimonas sp.]|uniref:HD domain-containing phosphohydrolase n=1 Tax=Panacagrimonas sp. TaxID=2480088 RepID=UPI003B525BCD
MNAEQTTVLVVDDTPENIDVLGGILRPHYRVKVAINGERALALARSAEAPDLILLDIMMPGLSGYEVCAALKEHLPTRHIPVIFCTAMGEVEDERRGFELGCVDYIAKPVSAPLVLARVQTHLTLYRTERTLERRVAEKTAELADNQVEIIRSLGKAAEFKDDHTGFHVIRMSHYARLLGRACGMTAADAELLMLAAPMHDVGKIGIPDHILRKPAKLDADEWATMQQHVQYGAEILGTHRSELLRLANTIALTHHEKWDGSGYPDGLAGEAIPLVGRIVAIADVFDALCSVRPYKPAWPVEQVVAYLVEQRGKHFDPHLVDLSLPLVPEFMALREQYPDVP